jgi:hypothetical protein
VPGGTIFILIFKKGYLVMKIIFEGEPKEIAAYEQTLKGSKKKNITVKTPVCLDSHGRILDVITCHLENHGRKV